MRRLCCAAVPVRGRFILFRLRQKLKIIVICWNVNRLTATSVVFYLSIGLLHDIDGVILSFTFEYLIHLVRWKLCGISNLSIHQDEYLVDKLHPNIFHLNTVHLFSTVYFDLKRSSCVRVRQQLVCIFTFLLLKVVPINLYFKVF